MLEVNVLLGFIFAVLTFGFFDATRYQKEVFRTNGKVALEHRLYTAMFRSFLLPIGLLVSSPD